MTYPLVPDRSTDETTWRKRMAEAVNAMLLFKHDDTRISGTFTATGTGFTITPSGTASYTAIGGLCSLYLPALAGTSNATSFTVTGLPAAIQPATLSQQLALPGGMMTNNSTAIGTASVRVSAASGILIFFRDGLSTGWTASGIKGFAIDGFGLTFTYLLK